jgi:uridine kinase
MAAAEPGRPGTLVLCIRASGRGHADLSREENRVASTPMTSPAAARQPVLAQVVELVLAVERPHPTRVAIDGPDASGKTTLADELEPLIRARGRPVIRASIDGFHRPRLRRHARGRNSPDGYYRDSFDLDRLRQELLKPLGPGGNRSYRTVVFDHRADRAVRAGRAVACSGSVLLFDGVFLLRPELDACWDVRMYVEASTGTILKRAVRRDRHIGPRQQILERYRVRYLPAQDRYRREVNPLGRADAVIDNDNPAAPRLRLRSQP